jgi:hypothetical protein
METKEKSESVNRGTDKTQKRETIVGKHSTESKIKT